MTALLVVGIFVLGFILAREANTLGVAAVGRLMGAPVVRENVYRNFSLTTVDLTYETHSMTRLLALYAGGMLGVAAWICLLMGATLIVTMLYGTSPMQMPDYAFVLIQQCLQLCNAAVGLPFRPDYWGTGLLVKEGSYMTTLLGDSDPILISLIWLSRVAAIYMGVTALPLIIGISANVDVVRRWLLTLGGEGMAAIYIEICTVTTWVAVGIVMLSELSAAAVYL